MTAQHDDVVATNKVVRGRHVGDRPGQPATGDRVEFRVMDLLRRRRSWRSSRPISPARLAGRIGLTTGATSTLLNRMEDAGHIRRTREHSDRRVVTLHSTPAIHETFDAFVAPLADRLRDALSGYSTAELDLVDDVVDRLRTTMDAYATTVRDTSAADGP